MSADEAFLTYREAAARVRRSVRSMKRWRKHGLPMTWGTRDGQRVRLVHESDLTAYWRRLLHADLALRPDVPRTFNGRWEPRPKQVDDPMNHTPTSRGGAA